jgi:hypothetical protein
MVVYAFTGCIVFFSHSYISLHSCVFCAPHFSSFVMDFYSLTFVLLFVPVDSLSSLDVGLEFF